MLVGMRQMFVLLFVLFMVPVGSQVTLGPTMRDCSDFTNTSCEECLENVSCLWCFVDQRCMKYPVETIIPSNSICPLNEARWGVCWVNFECLIIAMSVVGGLILLPLVCCCCYCCCKKNVCRCCKRKSLSYDEEEEILAKLQEERKQYRKKRDADKKARYDEICKKYDTGNLKKTGKAGTTQSFFSTCRERSSINISGPRRLNTSCSPLMDAYTMFKKVHIIQDKAAPSHLSHDLGIDHQFFIVTGGGWGRILKMST
ncbi:uncharacterized protein [Chiloscyllium punctatum]|uniref:uncharacterized protein isoform X1 n=1 Tax=Chiloscyllium punctatum TaxID=137246 RepID=UPI003B633E17